MKKERLKVSLSDSGGINPYLVYQQLMRKMCYYVDKVTHASIFTQNIQSL